VSSDPSFRGVLKDVTRERCGSQGTPFRRILLTTISERDNGNLVDTYQSLVAGGHTSQTEIFLPGCIKGCHARTVRLPRNTIPQGSVDNNQRPWHDGKTGQKLTSHLWLAGIPAGLRLFLPGCIKGCHARTVRLPRNTIPQGSVDDNQWARQECKTDRNLPVIYGRRAFQPD
jgi:hypothetical protein